MSRRQILVIKLSSLGDVLWALPALQAIRRHHQGDHITIWTTKAYAKLIETAGVADAIELDPRTPIWQAPFVLLRERKRVRGVYQRVYDLQWSARTDFYWRAWPRPKPEWVGVAPSATFHYQGRNERKPITQRQREMLALVGITDVRPADLSFLKADLSRFALPARYALLVPGSSPHRLYKRWPVPGFIAVAQDLMARGIRPVLVGGPSEQAEIAAIRAAVPEAIDLGGDTSLAELAELGRGAVAVIGNDTGPLYTAALAGAPALAFYTNEIDPKKIRPPHPDDIALTRDKLDDLTINEVLVDLDRLLAQKRA